jgi:radical SAM protein with 4Fe4S-binding SPASM domain
LTEEQFAPILRKQLAVSQYVEYGMAVDFKSEIARLKDWVVNDLYSVSSAFQSYRQIDPGLYTFKIRNDDQWEKRVHLRVENDGAGKLFVDVTDVIHLDPLSVGIVKLALDGISISRAKTILSQKYRLGGKSLIMDIERLYSVIEHFLEGTDGCQTCALTGLLSTSPLFSLDAKAPYKIDLALTYGCNNQCPHCYNEAGRLDMPSLPLEKWKVILDKVAEIGIPHVILTGGEATLHPDFLEIVRYADRLGMVVGLNSNGRYLANRDFMERTARAGLNHVQITLGSCYPEVHNSMMGAKSFHQTVKGIVSAVESGVHVITNTTLINSNIDHVEEIIDFIYDKGIRTFAMNGMIHSGGGFENPEAIREHRLLPLLTQVKQYADARGMRFLWYTPTEYCRFSPFEIDIGVKRCNAGEYSVCIEPNGDVLPCQSYYVPAGNLVDDEWDTIWNSELFRSFRDRKFNPVEAGLPEKCWDCPDFSVCGGGCRIEREAQAGIRIADVAGGGCIGCTGFSSEMGDRQTYIESIPILNLEVGSFVPYTTQAATKRRSSGKLEVREQDSESDNE